MANFSALASARQHVLERAGWDVERDGLTGAPRVRVVVGAKRHGTIDRALRMLGLGSPTDVIEVDSNGRMLAEGLRLTDEPTIVCAQAGEVNTGAFDQFETIADACEVAANAWLHIDGAFGLWAAVPESLRHLVKGSRRADSWATDAHKWLNVPYDCRHRVLPASRVAARSVLGTCGVPRLRRRVARRDGLDTGILAPRTRLSRVCGDPLAGTRGDRRPHRALLCARSTLCGRPASSSAPRC